MYKIITWHIYTDKTKFIIYLKICNVYMYTRNKKSLSLLWEDSSLSHICRIEVQPMRAVWMIS